MESQPPIARIDPHLAQWIMFILSLVFFGIAILGAIGEYLGWWNLIGEVAMTVGTVAGLLLGFASYLTSSTEAQIAGVAVSVDGVAAGVDGVAAGVEQANDTLGQIDEDLDKLDKLDKIEAALVAQDGQTSKLDRQTGVLDRQVGLLTEIRDRL